MRHLRIAFSCTIAMIAVVLAPAAAGALTIRVSEPRVVPHLDATGVVWGEERPDGLHVRAADAGGKPRALGLVAALAGRSAFDLAVGGGGVAVSRIGWPSSTVPVAPDRYSVALLSRPPLIDCAAPAAFLSIAAPPIAGDGVTLVSPGAGCRGDAVLVRTPGVPDRTVAEPGPVVELRVDGDWLAAIVDVGRAGWLVVHDLRTQREAYRVALRPPSFAAGSTPDYAIDVDRDGTAVVGEPNLIAIVDGALAIGPGCELWWASPADPRQHVLPLRGCATVGLHDGVLALALRRGPLTALTVTDLAATRQVTVRRAAAIDAIDLAGDRVAWREQSCREKTYVRTSPLRAEAAGRRSGCVIRVLGRGPLRMAGDGGVRVAVECPEGCVGAIFALRCGGQRCIARPVDVRLAARGRTAVRLVLTARARRLARRGGLRATIKTYTALGPNVVVERAIVARRAG